LGQDNFIPILKLTFGGPVALFVDLCSQVGFTIAIGIDRNSSARLAVA
jgi:hypothetical protein